MVDKLKYFDVPFAGLSLGNHTYKYTIDQSFFTYFNQQMPQCKFEVSVVLNKQPQILNISFNTVGEMQAICGRCTDEFIMPIVAQNQLLIKFGLQAAEEDVDVMVIPNTETHINLAQYIYEYVMVAIPMHQVHPTDNAGRSQCNQTFLKQIEKRKDESAQLKQQTSDPRWDILKQLNNNN
ncbi:MAG: DUF177 domain-containing protein [Bacteroidia bacterium]|nr:DUF177 domain-containing protein [Bacteroidia bacterium]HQV01299.1 DUF177 domain-containing protein [Bacteroidia bacterium]